MFSRLLKNKTLLFWFIGFSLITIFLYFTVFRHPGYIFYWDLSGAFSLRAPFEQYFSTYTLYDGTEVGLKNRIPTVSVIWLLTKIVGLFGGAEGEIAVKVAVWLMFVGAYTGFFLTIHKLDELFSRKFAVLDRVTNMGLIFRVVVSLLYLMIPFYSYRISQLHLFYFTTFYPLVIYFYLRFLGAERKDWFRWAGALVASLFFGITSPHSILYYAITFVVLTIATWHKAQWSVKSGGAYFLRLVLLGVAVATVSLYWLVPYLVEGSPAPGYVVNTDTIGFLSQNSTLTNFLLDISEWYMGQRPELQALLNGTPIITLQLVGLISMYGFALYYVFNRFKSSPYVRWLLVLLVLCLLFGVKSFPGFQWIYEHLSFSSFGWIIREPNRIRFIWSYWMYVFAVLGFYRFIVLSKATHWRFVSLSSIMTILVTVVSYGFYVIPGFLQHVGYLKPTVISDSFTEIQTILSKEQPWGGVLTYPRIGGYGISWKKPDFAIADETEYLFLPYNLVVPPVQRASVLASGQSTADALGQAYLKKQLPLSAQQLRNLGIEYFLITKDPRPLFPELPKLTNEINEVLAFLAAQSHLIKIAENSQYALFKVDAATASSILAEKPIYTSESRIMHSQVEIQNGQLVRPEETDKSTPDIDKNTTFLVYEDNQYALLDYLPGKERFRVDLYPSAKRYSSPVPWGRFSLLNKVNGEARNIFLINGITTFDTDARDRLVYSDNVPANKQSESFAVPLRSSCEKDCMIFLKVLKNTRGGKLLVTIGTKYAVTVDTKYTRDTLQWVRLSDAQDVKSGTLGLAVTSGFQAIADVLIIPKNEYLPFEKNWKTADVRLITPGIARTLTLIPACRINESFKKSSVSWDVQLSCPDTSVLQLPNQWKGSTFFYNPVRGDWKVFETNKAQEYELNGRIYLVTVSTVLLWILLVINYTQILVVIGLLARRRKV